MTVSRWTGEPGLDTLLADYHLTTEAEKGTAVTTVADLPPRYRTEALTPATAFASDTVFVARQAPPVGHVEDTTSPRPASVPDQPAHNHTEAPTTALTDNPISTTRHNSDTPLVDPVEAITSPKEPAMPEPAHNQTETPTTALVDNPISVARHDPNTPLVSCVAVTTSPKTPTSVPNPPTHNHTGTPTTTPADNPISVTHHDPNTPLVGCVVVTALPDGDVELKRLWVAESARGRGVARALLLVALTHAESVGAGVRLSVWRWRTAAVALYARHGFTEVPSWDDRPDLLCLRRGA